MFMRTSKRPLRDGDIVALVNTKGSHTNIFKLKPGSCGVVVDGRQKYPKLYNNMVEAVGYKTLHTEFVCVDFFDVDLPNGYFYRGRFCRIGQLTAASKPAKEVN